MPQNFNTGLTPQSPGDVTRPDVGQYATVNGENLARAGVYTEKLGETLGKARDTAAATEFQQSLGVASDTNDYYQKMHEYKAGMAAAADKETFREYDRKLETLVTGREQGVFTPMDAEVRINNLVKEYSQRLPHMSTYFRSAGSAGRGNGSSAMAEMYGTDPREKAQNELIQEAIKQGTTPQAIIEQNRVMQANANNKATWDNLLLQGQVASRSGQVSLDRMMTSHLAVRDYAIRTSLLRQIQQQPNTTDADITRASSIAQGEDETMLAQAISDFQTSTGAPMEQSAVTALYGKIDRFYTNFNKELGALGTNENRAKWLKTRIEIAADTGKEGWMGIMGRYDDFAGLVASKSDASFAALAAAAQSSKFVLERLKQASPDKSWDQIYDAYNIKYKDDPVMLSMVARHKSGELNELVAGGVVNILDQGNSPSSGSELVDTDAKQIAVAVYDATPYTERSGMTVKMVRALDFNELKVSKTLMRDVKANPEAQNTVLEKATSYTVGYIGMPGSPEEMAIDFSNPDEPFQFKAHTAAFQPGDRAPNSGSSIKSKEKANETFRMIRDNFGAPLARRWLTELETSAGVKPKWVQKGGPFAASREVDSKSLTMAPATSGGGGKRGASGTEIPNNGGYTPGQPSGETNKLVALRFTGNETSLTLDKEQGFNLITSVIEGPISEELSVPKYVQYALFQTESTLGQRLLSKDNGKGRGRARGPGQILEGTFNEVNSKYFGGELDWNSVHDTGVAALKFLDALYIRYNGDLSKVFNTYFTGSPDPTPGTSDGLSTAEDYTAKTIRNVEIWKESLDAHG